MAGNKGILLELEVNIVEGEMFTAPFAFANKILDKAKELRGLLQTPQNQTSRESEFRSHAAQDTEAKKRADDIMNGLLDILVDEPAEVVHHFMSRLSELQDTGNSVIRDAASKFTGGTPQIDKHMVHRQYMELRKFYEAYRSFNAFNGDNLPIMPALPGNYKPKASSVSNFKTYVYRYNGMSFINHFALVRLILKENGETERFAGEFKTRQDCWDFFAANSDLAIVIEEVK